MVIMFVLLFPAVFGIDYCQVDEAHILCEKENMRVSSSCPTGISFFKARKEDKEAVIETLNGYRSKAAKGYFKRGHVLGFKPAANMMEMEWDDDLASAADGYIKKCSNSPLCEKCSTLRNFKIIFIEGETSHKFIYNEPLTWDKYIQHLYFKDWSEENLIRDTSKFHNLTIIPNDVFVWAESYLIGCSVSIKLHENHCNHKVVCALGPAGPQPGRPIYLEGTPCTKCPDNASCSTDNPRLCRCEGICYPFNYGSQALLRRYKRQDEKTSTEAGTEAATTAGAGGGGSMPTETVHKVDEGHNAGAGSTLDFTIVGDSNHANSEPAGQDTSASAGESLRSSLPLHLLYLSAGMCFLQL